MFAGLSIMDSNGMFLGSRIYWNESVSILTRHYVTALWYVIKSKTMLACIKNASISISR